MLSGKTGGEQVGVVIVIETPGYRTTQKGKKVFVIIFEETADSRIELYYLCKKYQDLIYW